MESDSQSRRAGADRRARRLRVVRAAAGVGEAVPREARDAVRRRQARREEPPAHLLQQGRLGRRLRRRRRWLWLQLKAPKSRSASPAEVSARRLARCSRPRSRCPASCRTRRRRRSRTPAYIQFKYLDYRDWQPGGAPHGGGQPGLLRAEAAVRHAGDRRLAGLRRHVGRIAAVFQRAVRRVGRRRDGLPDRRRREAHEVLRPLLDRRRRRVLARARLHLARRLDRGSHVDRRQEPHLRLRFRRHRRPHQHRERRRAGRAQVRARLPRRRHAGALADVDRAVEPHVLARPRLLHRPVQAARQPPRPSAARSPGSRATTSTSRASTERSSSRYRYLDDSFGADSNMLEAAWVQPLPQGWTVRPSLRYYTQKAAYFFYGPADRQRLRARRAVHGGYAAVRVRRVDAAAS